MKHSPRVMCGLVVLLMTALTKARHSSCRQPSNQELAQYLSGGSSLHESFYQLSELRETDETYNSSNDGYRATFYDDGKNCSDGSNQDPCHVTWVFNYDSDRFPDTLVEAKCETCDRGDLGVLTCKPVYYYTKVLRKGDCNSITGVYNYKKMWERIIVGCALRGMGKRFAPNNIRGALPPKE